MPTLNATKWGYMGGVSSGTFSTARQNNAVVVANNPSNTAVSISYTATAGRGSLTHRMFRSFFTFDTSGITATPSSATLNFRTATVPSSTPVIAVKSSAFGGSNSNLVASEFFNNVAFGTDLSNPTTITSSNPFSITLNSTARTNIKNQSWFIVAVVDYANDDQNTAATTATDNKSNINWSTTPYLDYTLPSTSDISSVNGIALADISSVNSIAIADIASINGVNN